MRSACTSVPGQGPTLFPGNFLALAFWGLTSPEWVREFPGGKRARLGIPKSHQFLREPVRDVRQLVWPPGASVYSSGKRRDTALLYRIQSNTPDIVRVTMFDAY